MNLREIDYMLALDQYRSITLAANELHITQPALSIFLSNLEKEQGGALFERIGKKLSPTALGQSYLRYARQISVLSNDYDLERASLINENYGEFHFGCLERRISGFIPRQIHTFQDNHPGIRLILHSASSEEMLRQLQAGELDLLYTNSLPEGKPEILNNLQEHILSQDHILMVLPKGHPAAQHAYMRNPGDHFPCLDVKYVADEIFFLSRPGHAMRSRIENLMHLAHISPVVQTIPTLDIASQMAAEGLGVTFTMESYATTFSYDKPVDYYLVFRTPHPVTWRLVWRKSMPLSDYMQDFIDQLEEAAQRK